METQVVNCGICLSASQTVCTTLFQDQDNAEDKVYWIECICGNESAVEYSREAAIITWNERNN
jgi:hypothetical protein